LDEDQFIAEFAKSLEQIQKQPSTLRYSHTSRRKRKLKPNFSKDWVKELRKSIRRSSLKDSSAKEDHFSSVSEESSNTSSNTSGTPTFNPAQGN
jgi:hypothetical protein